MPSEAMGSGERGESTETSPLFSGKSAVGKLIRFLRPLLDEAVGLGGAVPSGVGEVNVEVRMSTADA